jgi:hypothetical protein
MRRDHIESDRPCIAVPTALKMCDFHTHALTKMAKIIGEGPAVARSGSALVRKR